MNRWISLAERKPSAMDADPNGDVLYLRSGLEVLGRITASTPVDATHWRPTQKKSGDPFLDRFAQGRPSLSPAQLCALDDKILSMGEALGISHGGMAGVLFRYRESNRSYHDFSHLARMFSFAWDAQVELSRAQFLAVLFHDAIYVPGAQDGMNEKLSALLLGQACHGLDAEEIRLAQSIILDTITHRATTEAAKVVLDMDLAGLGQPRDWFERDSRMVYEEVRHLVPSWEEYTVKRAAFFETLLKRRRLYVSGYFDHLEAPARRNMLAACMEQSSQSSGST